MSLSDQAECLARILRDPSKFSDARPYVLVEAHYTAEEISDVLKKACKFL